MGLAHMTGRMLVPGSRRRLPPLLLPVLLAGGCSAPDPGPVRLIGHGGFGPDAAFGMNTREAVVAAFEQGLDGVELDVQLTADTVLVAYHDLEVQGPGSCHGPVNRYTLMELNACFAQTGPSTKPRLEALEELLAAVPVHQAKAEYTLDVKLNTKGEWWPYLVAFSEAIAKLDEHPRLHGRLLVECRTGDFLKVMRERAPHIPLYLYCDDAREGIPLALELGCAGITVQAALIDATGVSEAHAAGLSVTLFGVDGNLALRSALRKGPDRIQVDP